MPSFCFAPFIGTLVDRYDRKTVMITTSLLRAAIVPLLIFCTTPESVPAIYTLIFLKSLCWTIFQPAKAAAVPFLVPKDELILANGLDGLVWSAMIFLGSAAGGLVTATLGTTAAYCFDSACYVLSAYWLGHIGTTGTSFAA